MKVAFSFAIYGSLKKYCQGLVENLQLIQEHYPSFYTFIYVYHDVPTEYIEQYQSFPKVCIVKSNDYNRPNMVDRFFVLDQDPTIDVMIVRDADSRIHIRDRYCIDHFIQSSYKCHTIRDHYAHHSPIMGGLWGLKRGLLNADLQSYYSMYKYLAKDDTNNYGHDMNFFRAFMYKFLLPSLIVYTFSDRLRIHPSEHLHIIPHPIQNNNFCGQVMIYDGDDNKAICEFSHPGELSQLGNYDLQTA